MVTNRKSLIFISIFLLISLTSLGQNVRGFYVQDVGDWLGDASEENEILAYAQGNGFNYINFYDLSSINWSSTSEKNKLAAFIKKGRTQYGVTSFGAVIENYDFAISKVIPFNQSRSASNEKFDVINLEFEFWNSSSINNLYCSRYLSPNGYSCDSAGAYKFAWKQFKKIDSLCTAHSMISEFYLGWPNKGQIQQILSIADRIFLHAYRQTDSDIYSYSRNRLSWAGGMGTSKKVILLLSSENTFMGPWLDTHPQTRPYNTYKTAIENESSSFADNINLYGYHWFTYKHMPYTIAATASITASGPTTFCSGNSVTLTANSGSAYLWTPGGQTSRSITVTSAGSYKVKVTNSAGVNATSSTVVVTISTSGVTPTVTATSQPACGDVTIQSSSASSYHWSTGETTRSITVSSSGNYKVTTGSGSCAATSSPFSVVVNPAPPTPVISANGPTSFCQGNQVKLTSSTATGYLWSNGATTRSITVAASDSYTVNAYNGPNCFTTSVPTDVTVLSRPPAPTITSTGSTSLSGTNTSVTLTSSYNTNNRWSTGTMAPSITVSVPGSYTVTKIGSNGCESTSNPVVVDGIGCTPPSVPTITASGATTLTTSGQNVTLTSSQAGNYLWSTGETTRSITVSAEGDYTVLIFDIPGCFSESLPITVVSELSTGVNDISSSEESGLLIYPNPAKEQITVRFNLSDNKKITLNLSDITGRIVQHYELRGYAGENVLDVSLPELTRGMYFVNLSGEGENQTRRLIIR